MSAGRLVDALRAEHAAIYAYGALGARLDAATAPVAVAGESAHRSRRDKLTERLRALRVSAPPAEPAYALPEPVPDKAAALRLMVTVEERCAAIWRQALPEVTGDDRALAVDALVDCAVRAAKARTLAGVKPATVPFPGR
ncbi:ferritin-like domain-containing protein [Planosporangium sp. 12N6]|uniref:ferritin-like domain-containing protein n=1 Tax=Planosporangium spinosum TaxID=3402278 RepID=UPI003CF2E863